MVQDWNTPNTNTPDRVYVNGTRIPVSDTDIHLRKEGPLDITRYAEVTFASPLDGEDYLSLFKSLTDSDNVEDASRDTLRIDVYEESIDEYTVLFNGVVTGVGGSESDNQKVHQCRAQGPGHFLENIKASQRYENNTAAKDVITNTVETLDRKIPLTIQNSFDLPRSSRIQDANESSVIEALTEFAETAGPLAAPIGFAASTVDNLLSSKSFTANRHTLEDVIEWFKEKKNIQVWIQPTKKGGVFTVSKNTSKDFTSHNAHYLDGNVTVINNHALREIKPFNTVIVNGAAQESFNDVGESKSQSPSGKFTRVKARHKPLYKLSGNTELTKTVYKSDAQSKTEVINEAKSVLKSSVDSATGGSMQVTHDKYIQPFDTVEAKPTTNAFAEQSVPTLTYEIHRCHYKCRPNDSVVPHINLNAGIHTDMEEDIEIISANKQSL